MRGMIGVLTGVAVATVGLRLVKVAQSNNLSAADVAANLPQIVTDDVAYLYESAKLSYKDGLKEADRARQEFDLQVLSNTRRTKE